MLSTLATFWQWLTTNTQVFNALISIATLMIWAAFLQLALHGARLQRRSQILIRYGHEGDIDSPCLISNMSQGAVFVESIVARLALSDQTLACDITELTDKDTQEQPEEAAERAEEGESVKGAERDLSRVTRLGPLSSSQYMEASTFARIIEHLARMHDISLNERLETDNNERHPVSLEIGLIAIYGTEKRPVGARRCFDLKRASNGRLFLAPRKEATRQLRSRRQRIELNRWRRHLNTTAV